MEACHARDALDPTVILSGMRNMGTFAFIANPGSNEIAIADMDRALARPDPRICWLRHASHRREDPEAIASTQDGCWVVTANRTSCDFTMLDPARLLAPTFSSARPWPCPATQTGPEAPARGRANRPQRHRVLYSSTGEIAFLPVPTDPAPTDLRRLMPGQCHAKGCRDLPRLRHGRASGFLFRESRRLPTTPLPATATIVSAFYIRPDLPGGFLAAGDEPVCPSDCAALSDDNGAGWRGRGGRRRGRQRLDHRRRRSARPCTCNRWRSCPTARASTWEACSTPPSPRWTSAPRA
jgi:hypothetical protein